MVGGGGWWVVGGGGVGGGSGGWNEVWGGSAGPKFYRIILTCM